MVIMRTWIKLKYLLHSQELLRSKFLFYSLRNLHFQPPNTVFVDKATTGIRMTVCKTYIWFYIEYRCAVHKVGTTHKYYRTVFCIIIHLF